MAGDRAPAAQAGQRRKRAPQPRRVPRRTCVGCREVLAKRALVRIVRGADGRVSVDPTGKAPGRGAYLHDRRSCWEQALRTHALERALKTTITEADRASLKAHGEQYSND